MKYGKMQGKTAAKRVTHVTNYTASNSIRPLSVLTGTGAESLFQRTTLAYSFKE
jgi:hypothetical protein